MAKAMKSASSIHDVHILGHIAGSFQTAWKASEIPRNFPGSSSRELIGKFRLGNFRALALPLQEITNSATVQQENELCSFMCTVVT
jgi:hypothetical protein